MNRPSRTQVALALVAAIVYAADEADDEARAELRAEQRALSTEIAADGPAGVEVLAGVAVVVLRVAARVTGVPVERLLAAVVVELEAARRGEE